jgi:Nitroreductase family.
MEDKMDLFKAINERHSVRTYTEKKIEGKVKEDLYSFIEQCNQESGLHLQLILDKPETFSSFMAHYSHFSGVKNYIALVGKKSYDLEEKCGYFGEKIVLYAQTLGLNTCWVALTYSKSKTKFKIDKNEKLCLVIALGYGENQGIPHKSKSRENVMTVKENPPEWFIKGIDAALLAPTAINQQKFTFSLINNHTVLAKAGLGFYSKIDLGIAKYHFEIGAGKENFQWK